MISNLYKIIYKHKDKKTYLFVYRIIKVILNLFYPIYCKYNKRVERVGTGNVIISLTTFPQRIKSVWIVIETLLRQTYKPQKIILWLASSQFDSLKKLPKKLLAQQKRGLEIKFCDDLRSHKKYYYTMLNYPDSIVITVDDDMFYPENLVYELLATSKKHPNTVCCNLAHLIVTNNGEVTSYSDWLKAVDGIEEPSYYLVPIGCEGVLYPPGCLNKSAFDKELIKKLCPFADDLWLKAMATLNGVKAVKTPKHSGSFVDVFSFKNVSLTTINVEQNMNDKQLRDIISRYPDLRKIWK